MNIHGGEATICDDFIEILSKIKELGYSYITLQTNGRKISNKDYAKILIDLNVKLFIVSVHGDTPELHDSITQAEGCFSEALQGIKNVKEFGAKVRTNTVVCKQNLNVFTNIVNKVLDVDVDHVNISAIHPVNKAYQNFHSVTPRYNDMYENVTRGIDIVKKTNKVITLEGFPNCTIRNYEDYLINWENIKFKLLYHHYILDNYADFMDQQTKRHGDKCKNCSKNKICGGVYKEYLEFYGWEEFEPFIKQN